MRAIYGGLVKSSDGTRRYMVRLLEDGTADCECKGFEFRGTCRHIKEARARHNESVRARQSTKRKPTLEELYEAAIG